MKMLHLGDLHLGKSLGEFDLIEDQRYILDQIMDMLQKESVDAVLVAGDVYDRAIPSEAATKLLDYFLCRLAERKVKVFIVSGNHDSDERLNFGSNLFEANQIYISAVFDGMLYKQTLADEYGEVDFYLLPFVKASQVKHFFPGVAIESYEDAVRTIIEKAGIDKSRRNVIVAHQFVTAKGEKPLLSGSEGVATQSVGLVELISHECFDVFDYVALGHIHSPQCVGREEVRYSGSMLKYSLSEVNNEKSVPIISLGKKGEVKMELHPLRPRRDMRHIKGKLADLLDVKNIKDPEDFIYVTLTEEDVVDNAMGIFQQFYPNTVKIFYENSHTKEIEQVDLSQIAENKSFTELISEFYQLMYGCGISEEEMKVMQEVAREAGVINETN